MRESVKLIANAHPLQACSKCNPTFFFYRRTKIGSYGFIYFSPLVNVNTSKERNAQAPCSSVGSSWWHHKRRNRIIH